VSGLLEHLEAYAFARRCLWEAAEEKEFEEIAVA